MSDDLISRKAVLEILYDISNRNYGSLFGHGINKACDVIEHAETAFDKEKVIEELKSPYNYAIMSGKHVTTVDRTVEIVGKGGIK